MNVLVVGGAGYIGSHVVLDLIAAGHRVAVFDNFSTGSEENLFSGVAVYRGDILIPEDVERVLAKEKVEAVIHLAALKFAGESMKDPDTYAHHNITGSQWLIAKVAAAGIRNFVFSSSAAVYGDPRYLPIDEAHPIDPTNFYGYTKRAIEHVLHWYSKLRGIRYVSLRYFNAAGYDPRGRVRCPERSPRNLIPVVMEAALGIREKLQIFGTDYDTPDGTCIRDYVHVSDLADAHSLALRHLAETRKSLTVNLGSEKGHSVLEVVEAAAAVTGSPVPCEHTARRPGDTAQLVASSALARESLGWQPRHADLETMLRTTWQVYRRQGRQSVPPNPDS